MYSASFWKAAYAATQWKVSIMKFRMTLALALFFFKAQRPSPTLSVRRKEQDIQREIGYAEKHNNQHRVDGLKKSAERSEKQTVQTASYVPIIRKKSLNRRTR